MFRAPRDHAEDGASTVHDLSRDANESSRAYSELDGFFTVTPDLACLADRNGCFTRLNPSWTAVLGWAIEDLVGQPYLDFVHPDDRPATVAVAASIAAGDTVTKFENRYAAADGSYRWLSWRARLDPRTGLIAAIARDVTERKASELQLSAMNQQLANTTRAKNEFLSRMSHDLRTPLNAILGFAQLLELDPLTPEQSDNVRHIIRGGSHLLELINEVLDIARIDAGQMSLSPEPVAIGPVVQQAIELVRPLATKRGITIELTELPADSVRADRQRLNQILLNLLSNAVKYNRERGAIYVDVSTTGTGAIRVVVRDTGAGISPEKLALLFTPFERLGAEQSAVEGTGLGLALTKRMAELMDGSITVVSVVDEGTAFTLELPYSQNVVDHPGPDSAAAPAAIQCQGVLLYIEDNAANVLLMERLVKRRPGVEFVHAPSGQAGLAFIGDRRPGVVFLDLHLPDMTGQDVLQSLWDNPDTRTIPVIVVTADATPSQRKWLMASGAKAYLTKPLDVGEVLRLIDRELGVHPGALTTGTV